MSITSNSLNANSSTPLPTIDGGTGVSSPTAHGVLIAEGASAYNSIVLSAGQVLIGTTSSDPVGATLTAGTNVTITSASGAITINASGGGGFTYTNVTATTPVTMAVNTGYINNAATVNLVFTLPTTAAVGSLLEVINGGNGFQIAQNSGQTITFAEVTTTTGTGGSITTTGISEDVRMICTVTNTGWQVISSVGNLTVV